jgi:hypothetical protein
MNALRSELSTKNGYLAILGWYGEERIARLGLSDLLDELNVVVQFDDGLILQY